MTNPTTQINLFIMSIPTYKKLETEQQMDQLVNYCISYIGHYFAYHTINNYSLSGEQILELKKRLIAKGCTIREHINSHGVPCFWVL